MCRPTHFRVDFKINPWMQIGSVNQKRAQKQWNELVNLYQKLGVKVEVIEQDKNCPDMVFSTDQAIIYNQKSVLLSRFRYQERRGESSYYAQWYKNNNYHLRRLPKGLYFEGEGETQTWRNKLLIGTGFRTSKKAALKVGEILGKEVVTLKLLDERFYHLDTCLMALNNKVVFYYPKAFSKDSRAKLKKLIPTLIEFKKSDVMNFAANSMVVNSTVVMQIGNKRLANLVSKHRYQVKSIDLGEFMKAGGGAHCLTGILEEDAL